MWRASPVGQAGQAALEYAGVLAVVAAVLVLASGAVAGGAVANAVVRGLERAVCRVTGGECIATELSACTLRSRQTGGRVGVTFTFVKLGGSMSLLREELSDGSVNITLIDGADAAPTAALGASGGVRVGGDRVGGGAIARAELLVRLGRRRVWRRPDAAAADRLVQDIREHVVASVGERVLGKGLADAVGLDDDPLPPPDVSGVTAGVEGAVQADLGGVSTVRAGLRASLGGTRDRRSGRRTLVLALEGDVAVALGQAAGGPGIGGSGGPALTLTYDRRGEPLELAVILAGTGRGDLGLGLPRQTGREGDAGRVEVTARLDLQQDANRAVYERLLDGLSPAGVRELPRAVAALAARLRTSARRDVVRSTTGVTTYGADAAVAAGAGVGGGVEVSRTTTELRDAWTQPAGGAWEQRTDCLPGGLRP